MKQNNKLYSQNKIAGILGISRGAFSKWLKENGVSPKQLEGQKKLYDESVIKQYKKAKKERFDNGSKGLTAVELLQYSLDKKDKEIDSLRKQLEEKEEQLKDKNKIIADFGSRFATLADQAQKLNLADKKHKQLGKKESVSSVVVKGKQKTDENKGFFARLFRRN